jgi:hypothetical protein
MVFSLKVQDGANKIKELKNLYQKSSSINSQSSMLQLSQLCNQLQDRDLLKVNKMTEVERNLLTLALYTSIQREMIDI